MVGKNEVTVQSTSNYPTDITVGLTIDKENVEIIDEVTFSRTFDQMINNMRYKHLQEML